ncbi:MAG: anti-sigma factor family protein, partial [Planctomycetota bacterium]
MTTCQTAKDLIDKVVDGTIDSSRLDTLKRHIETCAACRAEFERCQLLEEVITDAFTSETAPERARERIVEKITLQPQAQVRPIRFGTAWVTTAVAATVTLAAGLLVGFAAGRRPVTKPPEPALPEPLSLVQTPMQVGELEGTVLVKHEGSNSWNHLESGATVHLGDTFHSTARSGFVLQLAGKASTIEVNQNSMLALTSYKPSTPNK